MKRNLLLSFLLFCFLNIGHSQIVYTLSSCTYAPIAGAGTPLPQCDDCMSGMVPIGFTFSFYGVNFTTCDISSNGFLTFNGGMGNGCCSGQLMPVATWPTMIAWSWDDMYTIGATFEYFTTGIAPNRIFVINYNNVGYCCSSSNQATVQIQLYETTNEIRILSANNNHAGRTATMGIQSIGNGNLVVPGRNSTSWTAGANECQSFTPGPPPPPANDNPCAAIGLTPYANCFYSFYTNQSATATAGVPAPGCAGYSGGDVWFSVTVPAGGALNFDTQTGGMLDGGMAIYSGPNCSTLSLIAGACDDNNSANGNMPAINLTGLTVGSTVWVRVWENGNNNNSTFGICVVNPNAPPSVMGSGAVYIGSNGGNPWGSTSNQQAMNNVFGVGGWTQAFVETANGAAIFVPTNCFIFIEGGDYTADEFNTFITANMALMEAWVAIGGRLIINAAPNEGGNINYGFGGVTLIYDGGNSLGANGNAAAGQAGNPIFNGPSLPCGTAFVGNWFAHAWISGGGTTSLIDDFPGPSLTEKIWGAGRVLFGGMTTSNWHTPIPNGDNLMTNIVNYQASCITPLPVELTSFTGTCSDQGTQLNWQTSSEINNALFIVETSDDAVNYTEEIIIEGAGNSNQLLEYSYLSPFRSYPGNYFRLVQKDYNGAEKIYGPIYISCHESNNTNCAIVNTLDDQINVSIYSAKADLLNCTLTDIQGKVIKSVQQSVSKGTSTLSFDGSTIPSGVYIVLINGTDSQCSNKFIKP